MIFGERIRQARELKRWTQQALAERLGLKQPAIAQFESGQTQPERSVLEALSFQLGFPIPFFEAPPLENFPQGTLLFRARASMSAKGAKQAYAAAATLYEVADVMCTRMKNTKARIPRVDLRRAEDLEGAAAMTRSAVGLSPDKPIPNLTLVLERAGVLVLGLWEPLEDRDAFSLWAGPDLDTPVIAAVPERPGDRLRFSLAHELGHLVMHQAPHAPRGFRPLEREADRFAGAFLLPAEGIRPELGERPTLSVFAKLKSRWGVSMQALIMRSQALGALTPRQVKYLYQQMQRRGWRKEEPIAVPQEKPRRLRKMAELLYGIPIDVKRFANDSRLRGSMAEAILGAHASQAELAKSGAKGLS